MTDCFLDEQFTKLIRISHKNTKIMRLKYIYLITYLCVRLH